jgi:hypothetical protein
MNFERQALAQVFDAYSAWSVAWLAAAEADDYWWIHEFYGWTNDGSPETQANHESVKHRYAQLWVEMVRQVLAFRWVDQRRGLSEVAWTQRFLALQQYGKQSRELGGALDVRLDGPAGEVYLVIDEIADLDFADLIAHYDVRYLEFRTVSGFLEPEEAEQLIVSFKDDVLFDYSDADLEFSWSPYGQVEIEVRSLDTPTGESP